jgi:predicted amidophosphoribosyltransferase
MVQIHGNSTMFQGTYHPKRRGTNPLFDHYSQSILDLKEMKPGAVEYFVDKLNRSLTGEGYIVAVVPGHSPQSTSSGIKQVAIKLCHIKHWWDGSDILRRKKEIHKLAWGGNRDIATHLGSIEVTNKKIVKGSKILLIDDVSTTGNSLEACRILLKEAGAHCIRSVALGKTSRD